MIVWKGTLKLSSVDLQTAESVFHYCGTGGFEYVCCVRAVETRALRLHAPLGSDSLAMSKVCLGSLVSSSDVIFIVSQLHEAYAAKSRPLPLLEGYLG